MDGQARDDRGRLYHVVNTIEETVIAVILGLMTLITFVNVVLRYGEGGAFLTGIETLFGIDLPGSLLWGLEVVLVLFAWLVLFGISYAFKVRAHLGVDAVLNLVGGGTRRVLVLLSAVACIAYGGLVLKGAWDYWAPFAGLDRTTGRAIPTGFDDTTRDQAFYIPEQIPVPFGNAWLSETFNSYMDGDERVVDTYDKLPRFIPYAILPFGIALMLFRIVQATVGVVRGREDSLIVSHEAEEAVAEVADLNRDR